MSEEEARKLIDSMKQQTKEITSSKASAQKFLQDAGILTPAGKFAAPYRELGKACTVHTQD
ncbi:MAG: hypothetical protein P1U86_17215 [Verrucomicrobiales bacterium]|nr:hypothetical protein [Verrucomicrobiales bacterium]